MDRAGKLPGALRAVDIGDEVAEAIGDIAAGYEGLRPVSKRVLDRIAVEILAAIGVVGRSTADAMRRDGDSRP